MPGAIVTGLQGHLSEDELRGLDWNETGGTPVPGPGPAHATDPRQYPAAATPYNEILMRHQPPRMPAIST
jgi:hypothetical protein